jgi:hypothetical protein
MANVDWREAVDVCRVPAYEIGATTHLCGAQRSVKQSSATHQRKAGVSLGSVKD